jgi:protein-disulfide isomerase
MRHSNPFLAAVTLASLVLLGWFGALTLGPGIAERRAALQKAEESAKAPAAAVAPKVDFANPARGADKPAVTVVEYGDYACEPCAAMSVLLEQVSASRPGKVRTVWKDLPNPAAHPDARAAAESARCAAAQGAFWPFHDLLLANQSAAGAENRLLMARQLGLDEASFSACVETKATAALVDRDVEEAVRLQVDATPYLFIGDRRVSGLVDGSVLGSMIDAAIAKAAPAK